MKAPKDMKRGPIDSIVSLIKRTPNRLVPAVGQTPHTVVWRENKWKLLKFSPPLRP